MMDKKAHVKYAIEYGCWESGEYDCRKAREPCGTDEKGRAFSRWVRIPTTYPDGDYVLGYVWFGGLQYKREKGQFPDFWSCSFVRISGGVPLGGWYRPRFLAGWNQYIVGGRCETSARAVGECGRYGCPYKSSYYSIPKVFLGGKKPDGVSVWGMKLGFLAKTGTVNELAGICKTNACCPRACGRCGGYNCNKLPRGESCCIGAVQRSKRPCHRFPPPCIRA